MQALRRRFAGKINKRFASSVQAVCRKNEHALCKHCAGVLQETLTRAVQALRRRFAGVGRVNYTQFADILPANLPL